jgi:peptidoglycan/LPS O-acetylase OafA/YrhL
VACANGAAYSVDSFFVLSAYLITELLLRERDKLGTVNTRAFYVRRILRVWPVYFLYVGLAATLPLLNPAHEFTTKYVLAFLFLVGNWSLVLWGWPYSWADHLWTVSVEEQFYLFWPQLVGRLNRKQLAGTAIAMIVIANLYRVHAVSVGTSAGILWADTIAHFDSIAAGVLISICLHGRIPKLRWTTRITLIAAASAAFIWRGYYVRNDVYQSLGFVGTILGFPLMVAACSAILFAFLGAPIRSSLLEYLGKISYGLYVYHYGCIALVDRYLPRFDYRFHFPLMLVLVFGSTILVSVVSYELFEKRFLRLKKHFTFIESHPA